jgi:hypothetical protein
MLILPTLLKAVGTGIGLLGQFGSANRYDQTAELNYEIDTFNAGQNRANTLAGLQLQNIGTGIELGASRTNLRLALADSRARTRNAQRMRNFAETRTKTSREAIRRQMRSFEEFQSGQGAAVAASGVTGGGSAMEVMLESANQFRTKIQDMHEEANFERRNTLDEAAFEQFGARQDAIGARANFNNARRGANLSRAATRIGRISAQTAYQSALMEAELDRLQGEDAARGQRVGAVGSILNGAAGFLSDRYTSKQLGM